ncbi:GspH/FimT family pseudopilin [Paraburkholderia jirisanensis]
MRTSARGNKPGGTGHSAGAARTAQRGFTLLEMLVVLMIAGILLAAVALVPTRNRRSDLNEEAQRLATMLESADDEAQVRSAPIAWQPVNGGYEFLQRVAGGAWRPMTDDLLKPHRWGTDVTGVAIRYAGSGESTSRVIFGDESVNVPVTVTLISGQEELKVVSTGVGNFAVQRP